MTSESRSSCYNGHDLPDLQTNAALDLLETLISVSQSYSAVHSHVCVVLCVFGSMANVIHFATLTRPTMRKNAINRLLSVMAVCDILTMTSYLVFLARFGHNADALEAEEGYEFHWACFLVLHAVLSVALHAVNLYLSVIAAYIRYSSITKVERRWYEKMRIIPIVLVVSTCVTLLCVPTFVLHSVVRLSDANDGRRLYAIELPQFRQFSACSLFTANLWLTGIAFKVLPCILLLVFTVSLLVKLRESRKRREHIASTGSARRLLSAKNDRTTRILIGLLSIFVLTELPQGIVAIANGLFPSGLYHAMYLSFGEFLDLLSLVNCNTCFVIYPLISSRYRRVLAGMYTSLYYRQLGRQRINITETILKDGVTSLKDGQSRTTTTTPLLPIPSERTALKMQMMH